jgi:hypothetical protein
MKLKYIAQAVIAAALTAGAMTSCSDDDAVLTALSAPQATLVESGYTTLSFKWDKVANATQYCYELRDAAGELVDGDVTTATSASFSGLTDDTSYTLSVWAYAAYYSEENTKSEVASLTVRTDALIPLTTPQDIEVDLDLDNNSAFIYWDPVELATSYTYTVVYNFTETTATVTKPEFTLTDLEVGYYQVYIYANPSENGYKSSSAATTTFSIEAKETDELWRATGKYYDLSYQTYYDEEYHNADIVALKDGSYKIESWGGEEGFDLCFTIDDSGTMTFTNIAEDYERLLPTYSYVYLYDGYWTCFYTSYCTFTGNQGGGTIEMYRYYPSGYDKFVW